MTTDKTCANCTSFDTTTDPTAPTCLNAVSFRIYHVDGQGNPVTIHQAPRAGDCCNEHEPFADEVFTDEFRDAMGEVLRMEELHGIDHDLTGRALQRAMAIAPPSMHAFMAKQGQELGLIPEADGYTSDGEPVFSLEAIAEKLGIPVEEAQASFEAMLADREEMGLPAVLVDPATVHRKQ